VTIRVTWWGHASVTVEVAGVRLLTDPVLTERVAHLVRLAPAPPPAAARADAVLVSHLHADHLHRPSLRRVTARALVVPAGGESLVRRSWPGPVVSLRPGEGTAFGDGVRVSAVPAHHDGRRHPLSHHRGPALGYLVEAAARRVWFAGDTGWFDGLADLAPVDVALVPVGGWGPTLGPHHLDPDEAARAAAAVGARHAVPIHFGTLWPTGLRAVARGTFEERFGRPGRRFADAVTSSGGATQVHLLRPGDSVEL
jgi:L-ascorbate metabolism protein UlaG (beta-lactamase superfamily)